ncbi:MAG: ligase-associated DNA damage response endonuclease PdeM [Bdellovibrionota bacterium]
MGSLNINLANSIIELHPSRAAFWIGGKTLFLSDLHLGKAESYQSQGVPLPSGGSQLDLSKIKELFDFYHPEELWILGDFIHSKNGLSQIQLLETFAALLTESKVKAKIILGNHDRPLRGYIPESLRTEYIEFVDDFIETEDFICSHDDLPMATKPVISGHIHPVIKIRSGFDSLRLPCFLRSSHGVLLPAFSSLAGGFEITPKRGDEVYVVAGDSILKL